MLPFKFVLGLTSLHYFVLTNADKPVVQFTGEGYTHLQNTNSFYKFNQSTVSWYQAVELCEADGAKLYYPENEKEAKDVAKLLGLWDVFMVLPVWIGISDLKNRNVFETIDGRPISEVYSRWNTWKETEVTDEDRCVQMWINYDLFKFYCNGERYVVCKYSPVSIQRAATEKDITNGTIDITTSKMDLEDKAQDFADCPPHDIRVDKQSKSHLYFGNIVADEIRQYPNKEKIRVMASILKVIRDYTAERDGIQQPKLQSN